MIFAAPIWLLALVPWLALTAWLLQGQRPKRAVPFLPLWRGLPRQPRQERAIHLPPLAIALCLAAALLAIAAAARPVLTAVPQIGGPTVTVVLDRGITCSATGADGRPRFAELASEVQDALLRNFGPGDVLLVDALGGTEYADRARLGHVAGQLPRTAVDASQAVRAAVADQLLWRSGPVVAITDQTLPANERLVQVAPARPLRNVGIVALAARAMPVPQVMVRVRNDSDHGGAVLRLQTGGESLRQPVDLPPAGAERDCFLTPAALGDVVDVALESPEADDLVAGDEAWLVREGSPPRIEPSFSVSAELRRMIDVYEHAREQAADAPKVSIARDAGGLSATQRGIVLPATAPQATATQPAGGAPLVVDHPVTAVVRWREALAGATFANPPPPAGWTPLVTADNRVVVAAREGSARQVWIGFDSGRFPATTDFVVFWTNVLDWLGGGSVYASYPVGSLDAEWQRRDAAPRGTDPRRWPGLFRRPDGALRAVNAPDVHAPPMIKTDWRSALVRLSHAPSRRGRPLAPALLLAAAACLLLATAAWPRT